MRFFRLLPVILCAAIILSSRSASAQPPLDIDGKLGPKTAAAVKRALKFFQDFPESRGNYLPPGFMPEDFEVDRPIEYLNSAGEPTPTQLNTVANTLVDLGQTLSWMKDRKNMLEVYRLIYPIVPKEFTKTLLKPKQLKSLPLPDVKKAYRKLTKRIVTNFGPIIDLLNPSDPGTLTVNPIGECSAELGYEVAGSESEDSERCDVSEYNPNGLMANVDFPLKDNLTCIKDQGSRGTCVAQAAVATVESLAMLNGDPAKNLSEQHFYYRGETEGDIQLSLSSMQLSGLTASLTLDAFDTGNWGIFYESGWNYNQSTGMGSNYTVTAQGTLVYVNSCDGNYTGEDCSNYSWQTDATVALPGVPNPLAPPVIAPVIHNITSSSYLPADAVGGVVSQSTLFSAILLVSADVPAILSISVTNAFRSTTDGFVTIPAGNDPVSGGHALELIAFVENSDLPANVPPASQDGYFIVKNSWGDNSGDCGFYYLDYAYVLRHLNGVYVIDI